MWWWFIEKGYVSWARYIIQRKAPRESKPKTTTFSDRACRTSTNEDDPYSFDFIADTVLCSLAHSPQNSTATMLDQNLFPQKRDTPAGDLIQSGLKIRTIRERREDGALKAEQVSRLDVGRRLVLIKVSRIFIFYGSNHRLIDDDIESFRRLLWPNNSCGRILQ